MQKLVKKGEITDDIWELVTVDQARDLDTATLLKGYWLVPLETFLSFSQSDECDFSRIGVWLSSDQEVSELSKLMEKLEVIALNFNAFADGRSFSQARVLREQLDYTGEIRATGAFIQDQLAYLKRCGFDAFSVSETENMESLKKSLDDFSEFYQAACDEPNPLFRRRA